MNLKFQCFERCLISFKNFAKIQMTGPKIEIRPTFVWLLSYFSCRKWNCLLHLFDFILTRHHLFIVKKQCKINVLLSRIQSIIYLLQTSFESRHDRILKLLEFPDLLRRTNCSAFLLLFFSCHWFLGGLSLHLNHLYSIAHDNLRLAIWDTFFWTFWLKFGYKGPWDIS